MVPLLSPVISGSVVFHNPLNRPNPTTIHTFIARYPIKATRLRVWLKAHHVGKRSESIIQQLFHKMLVDLVRDDVKAEAPAKATRGIPHEVVTQLTAGGLFGLILW